MKVLIVGNMGYVGPVFAQHLAQVGQHYETVGLDSAFFAQCLTGPNSFPERHLSKQVFGDIRDITQEDLSSFDAVVCLAAISNDPMGDRYASATQSINIDATQRLARLARAANVRRFVFASSCSIYGGGVGDTALDETAPIAPLTAYARSKVAVEDELAQLASTSFMTTSLRFATACGMSPRLRLDLVLNDFVATAVTTGKIVLLSDGSAYRPLINVADMARALEWGLIRDGDVSIALNAGMNSMNYKIIELAEKVRDLIPNTEIDVQGKGNPDNRSYRVNFTRFEHQAPDHSPIHDLPQTVRSLVKGLETLCLSAEASSRAPYVRLKELSRLISIGLLDDCLVWQEE